MSGWIADRWGRKLPLMISLVWFAVFDAAIFFAPSFAWILALRTVFGFGMGAEWTAGTALAMESLPPKSRQMASGLLQAGWPVGFLLAAVTAYFVVPAFGWRAMFLVAVVPGDPRVPDPLPHQERRRARRESEARLAVPWPRRAGRADRCSCSVRWSPRSASSSITG